MSKGETIAVSYSGEAALERASQIKELEQKREYISSVLSGGNSEENLSGRDSSIKSAVTSLTASAARRETDALSSASAALSSLVIEDSSIRATQADLDSVNSQLAQLQQSAQQDTAAITATFSGLYSASPDGYEYITSDMAPSFEAEEVKVFGKMYGKGYIYRGKKPVYWCCHDETALAEAEIEYADDSCKSIYVKFRVTDDLGKLSKYSDLKNTYFVIWTTTTWTIPGNLAICLNADLTYVLAKSPDGEVYILAKELMDRVAKAASVGSFEVLCEMKGSEFEMMHEFIAIFSSLLL